MAWVPDQEKDKQLQTQATSPGTQGGGSVTPTPAAKPQGSGSWAPVTQMFQKNQAQAQKYGKDLKWQIDDASATANRAMESDTNAFKKQVDNGVATYDQNKVKNVIANPLAANQNDINDVKRMASGAYSGPTAFTASAQTNDAINNAKKTAASAPPKNAFDRALLKWSGAQTGIDAAVNQANNLAPDVAGANAYAGQGAARAANVATQTKQNPLNFGTTTSQAEIDNLRNRVSTGSGAISDQELAKLGLGREQWDKIRSDRLNQVTRGQTPADLGQYFTGTASNPLRDQALSDIFGVQPGQQDDGVGFDINAMLGRKTLSPASTKVTELKQPKPVEPKKKANLDDVNEWI